MERRRQPTQILYHMPREFQPVAAAALTAAAFSATAVASSV
jgi:hypothetical protein